MTEDQFSAIEEAVWEARPHAVPQAAARLVKTHFDASRVETLLADYRMAYLIPATGDAEPVPLDAGPAGRAYASQQVITEPVTGSPAHRLHLPLTVHGDRLGILTVELPGPPGAEHRLRLAAVASALARAIKIADGHTDAYRQIRRRARMTLAAEIQWDLLPARTCSGDEFSLAGQLEPAYAVWGDNFDWALAPDHLTVTVTNGMGRGTQAALLTHLTVSALRNARRSGSGLTEQAALANEIVYAHHHGELTSATLLLGFDLRTGRVTAVDAGSPLVYRLRGNTVDPIALEPQLPLGMFNDTGYTEEEFSLQPGDRLVVVSDGVHGALSPGGEAYGSLALARALRQTRLQGPPEAVRTLMRGLLDYHEDTDLADDAVIVCIDWTGKSSR
ncbi:Serine phosphatase RsbU, regulator of sigma subunit [Thermomonospora echinospora]|uniref:Serine phosphatase RsbU, regulator of sigma subunit n=1 Tax=Thermomonospora echinospora TaxID=1992 RepID=A0A1H5YJ60_9ACTN|nr:PP2C family protein-serine/threonine phosphatase [Thermomonospora echinospora]SEG23732.1 Serine phosphatase RsbU, regulator of sigma subunit [Thermomonospora echinospora]